MPKLRLSYFDIHGGRGEPARLALTLGKIPFEDHRIPMAEFMSAREAFPLRAVPVLEVDGVAITQSNTICRYVGRLAGLYPDTPLAAAHCDEVLDIVEDLLARIVATFGLSGEELREKRQALVGGEALDGPLGLALKRLEALLVAAGGQTFVQGGLTVADLQAFVFVRTLRAGTFDHLPVDLADRLAPNLVAHCDRVAAEPAIAAYSAES